VRIVNVDERSGTPKAQQPATNDRRIHVAAADLVAASADPELERVRGLQCTSEGAGQYGHSISGSLWVMLGGRETADDADAPVRRALRALADLNDQSPSEGGVPYVTKPGSR
jgi:hypothetical protein